MSSIGLIIRESRDVEELPQDWVPQPLGPRAEVLAVLERYLPQNDPTLALSLRVEEPAESEEPRTISASGVWGPREMAILKLLCNALGARFYDAESSEFIEL